MIAHEWLGMPLVFSALLHDPGRYRTVFYAHEVATARLLVENDAGHDTRFYNVLRAGLAQGHSLDEVFGDHSWYLQARHHPHGQPLRRYPGRRRPGR